MILCAVLVLIVLLDNVFSDHGPLDCPTCKRVMVRELTFPPTPECFSCEFRSSL